MTEQPSGCGTGWRDEQARLLERDARLRAAIARPWRCPSCGAEALVKVEQPRCPSCGAGPDKLAREIVTPEGGAQRHATRASGAFDFGAEPRAEYD